MIRTRWFATAILAVVMGVAAVRSAPEIAPPPRPGIDLAGYKTLAQAAKVNPKDLAPSESSTGLPGYLGVLVGEVGGRVVIEAVVPDSPAALAGLQEGDGLLKVGGEAAPSAPAAREKLRTFLAGDVVLLNVLRQGKVLTISAVLKPLSKPLSPTARPILGVAIGVAAKGGGVKVEEVTPGGPAARAGLKAGDVIVKIDGANVQDDASFRDHLAGRHGGDRLELIVQRGESKLELRPVLESDDRPARGGGAGWDDRIPRTWRKPAYHLAVLGIEYPDVKHNPKIKDADWEESLFSRGTYTNESATSQKVYGSMADFYKEVSYDTLKVEGKFLGWAEVSKKRLDYTTGNGTSVREKTALLTESLDAYVKKAGKDALKGYDGVFFLFAGSRVDTTRGSLYWPHRASVRYGDKQWPYFIVQEGGTRMTDISVFCHEFGHMLGLPDLYARPEQPGSEGLGQWCLMSNQINNGRPQHMSAWSKEQLGWIKPAVIDPRVKQKLILSPIENDPTQCLKVVLRPDGGEYYLLENRKKAGWDAALPGEGLLVWRVFAGSRGQQPVYLEESHGIEGPRGPTSFLNSVPFPSIANNSFTPYTTPSSKSQLGGGLPVWITNIRKLPDGRITLHIGYEYQ